MFDTLEQTILSTLQIIFDEFGWLGVFGLMVFENATGITPSEIILGLAGWMLISEHQLPPTMIPLGGLYAAIGSVLGASVAYWVARLGGRPLVDRLARWLRIDSAHIDRAENQGLKDFLINVFLWVNRIRNFFAGIATERIGAAPVAKRDLHRAALRFGWDAFGGGRGEAAGGRR